MENINGDYPSNWGHLISEDAEYIVKAKDYDVRKDERLLIPFKVHQKIGFVNRSAQIVVEPQYNIFYGDVRTKEDLVRVGIIYSYGFPRANGDVATYDRYKWGILDWQGNVIEDVKYASIRYSPDKSLFTLEDFDKGYCVVDRSGNLIVPYGVYQIIDGFTHGYARAKKNGKWGLINSTGDVVLPMEWDDIWSFYEKPGLTYTTISKHGEQSQKFYF
jgi:hypothetical protein